MIKGKLSVGGVYTTSWEDRPMRVIAFDELELFYDSWWEHKNDWGLRSHNGKVIFYRSSTSRFAETAKLLRVDPLSDEEMAKYKLDLPFRVCRHKEFTWSQTPFIKLQDYLSYCTLYNVDLSDEPILKAEKVVLQPFGPTGGHKKSIVVDASNGKYFSATELLWKAHNVQAAYKTFIDFGVGLFRSGLSKKLASYYIGGYYDLAQTIKSE